MIEYEYGGAKMKILIQNATLVSMDSSREQIEQHVDILIENHKIQKIAKQLVEKDAYTIDATNKIVMPGLINTHAHMGMSIFRETLDGYTLQDWLKQKIWPMESKLTKEDVYYAAKLSCLEMIRTGSTTINDMYGMPEETIKAALETQVGLQTSIALMANFTDENIRIQKLENLIQQYYERYDTISLNVAIHAFYTSNPNYMIKCVEIAKKHHLPIHIHFCENEAEVKEIQEMYQVQNPVEVIERYLKDIPTILAHGVKLTEEQIKQLSQYNVSVAHCPISNLKLGCGIAKISEMREQGISVGIGTDGQGSGSNLDLFEAMKYTALLQKGRKEDPKQMPAYEVLKMATMEGAKVLGLEKTIGSITEGKRADIILISMESILTQPNNNLIPEIVYNIKGRDVDTTIVNGEILMEHGKLRNKEEKEVIKKVNEIIHRIQN